MPGFSMLLLSSFLTIHSMLSFTYIVSLSNPFLPIHLGYGLYDSLANNRGSTLQLPVCLTNGIYHSSLSQSLPIYKGQGKTVALCSLI